MDGPGDFFKITLGLDFTQQGKMGRDVTLGKGEEQMDAIQGALFRLDVGGDDDLDRQAEGLAGLKGETGEIDAGRNDSRLYYRSALSQGILLGSPAIKSKYASFAAIPNQVGLSYR